MQYLKADTAVKVVIGPVVAVGDGFTPVTTLSLSTADEAEIMKHDASAVTDISSNTFAAITSADGYYNLTITAAQLDTEGMLTVLINDDSLCLPVRHDFMVVNANVYDSLFAAAATDYLQVDTIQVGGATEDIATETKQDVIDANVDAILVDTAVIGAAGAGLTAIPWNASWDAEVQSEVTDGLNAYDPPTYDELLAFVQLLARSDAAITTDRSTQLSAINANQGSGAGDYAATSESQEALRDRGDSAWITATGFSTHTAADVRTEMDANSTQLAAIVADTNELQTDWADAGRLDAILDNIYAAVDTEISTLITNVTAILVDTGTTLDAKINTVDTVVDAIKAVTDLLPNAGALTSIAQASVCTEARLAELDAANIPADVDTVKTAVVTTLPNIIDDLAVKKNTNFSNFEFLMVLASDGKTPATGLTVTGQRSIDGAAFASVAGTIAEVSNGIYQFDALAADTNGDLITWRFSAATADDTFVTFKTVQ